MPSEVVTAFTTAVGSIKTDILDFVVIALPVALAIFGTILAITKGKSFFSKLVGR
jgi:hypothetical protein